MSNDTQSKSVILPDFLKPKLRLFLSVDIVNSTAFKQSLTKERVISLEADDQKAPAEPWFTPIATFYREVERLFSFEWRVLSTQLEHDYEWPAGPLPELWKAAGDELLYSKVLSDHRQALSCLISWIKAINKYRCELKSISPMLDLKCAAWLAGFPVNNAEIMLLSKIDLKQQAEDDPVLCNLLLLDNYYNGNKNNQAIRDFIGPSIDTGFRVASLATSRKLALTVDLAWMLAHVTMNQPTVNQLNENEFPIEKPRFYYDGRVALKGVLNGSPYPVFWIDTHENNPLANIEDRISGIVPVGVSDVKEFCERFIAGPGVGYITQPFIDSDKDGVFDKTPEYHKTRLNALKVYWMRERNKRDIEDKSILEGNIPNEGETITLPEEASKLVTELANTINTSPLPEADKNID